MKSDSMKGDSMKGHNMKGHNMSHRERKTCRKQKRTKNVFKH